MKLKMLLGWLVASGLANAQVRVSEPIPQEGPAPLKYSAPSTNGSSPTTVVANGQQQGSGPSQQQGGGVVLPPKNPNDGLPREVFNQIVSTQIPLSPSQIKELNMIGDAAKKAHAERPRVMPAPVSRTISQNFSSGRVPELIRLAPDFTTSMVFVDSSGAPWPVTRVVVGNKNSIIVPELEGAVGAALKAPTSILTIYPAEDYVSTSISVLLEGAPSPINFILSAGQPSVDMRVDVLLAQRGPKSVAPIIEGNVSGSMLHPDFSAFIDGVPPKSAMQLRSDNSDVKAWIYGDKMILRTQIAIKSPFVFRKARGADGTTVFEVARSSSVVGAIDGRLISIGISGFPPPAIEALAKLQNKAQ